jgi:hypothetical protein
MVSCDGVSDWAISAFVIVGLETEVGVASTGRLGAIKGAALADSMEEVMGVT